MSSVDQLADQIAGLVAEIETIKSALSEMVQVGVVSKTDAKKGYRIELGKDDEDKPLLSPWLPHPETGKTSVPLKKGQTVGILNVSGDPRQGIISRHGYSKGHETPNQDMEANVFEDAGVRVEIKGGVLKITADTSVEIEIGGVNHTISGDGVITDGGEIRHNSKDIGDTHKHENSGGPNVGGVPV